MTAVQKYPIYLRRIIIVAVKALTTASERLNGQCEPPLVCAVLARIAADAVIATAGLQEQNLVDCHLP